MSRFFRTAGDSDSDSESSAEESLSSGSDDEAKPKAPATGAKPMSRFLRTEGGSDDSDESSEEDMSGDESEEEQKKDEKKKSRFLRGDGDDDDEDEDEKRVVKSAKDKRLDEMEGTGKAMENALKINDWVTISNEFDKLLRLVQRETNIAERVPSFFIKTVASLDGSLKPAEAKEKDAKKKMNANNARAMNQMKQRIKKTMKEYEVQFKQLQEDPEGFDREYAEIAEREATARNVHKKVKVDGGAAALDDEFTPVGKSGKLLNFTADSVFKTLQMVQEARGKKNTDRTEQLQILEKLLEVANTTYQRIRVLLALISSRFDYNTSVSSYLPTEMWLSAQRELDQLVSILSSSSSYVIVESSEEYDELVERTPETEGGPVRIRGSVIGYVDRLDDEFTKSLQNIDPHGTEYVDRLKDEHGLYRAICLAQAFFEQVDAPDPLARTIMRRLEHIYSKPVLVVQALEQAITTAAHAPSAALASAGSTSALVHQLCTQLYRSGESLLRTRAMLCHIYHYALHNDFHTARDMLLMSHLQESIHGADVGTQILYNRAIVQLGLSAFRCGMIKESQAILQDIFTTQRVKELLAQGVHQQRYGTLTPEQEKAERQRQLPFHTHINTELLEAAFLVACMLVEIPLLASIDSDELKRKAISKPFRRLLDFADRQVFTGPPESTRDHIMQASKALQDGEWEKCRNLIQSIKIWSLMPEEKAVKEMLARRIQEEALRTYLFTYAPHYTTLSLAVLASTFALPQRTVASTVSKMIWNEELAASLAHGAGVLVFHRVEQSRTQHLAQALADRVAALVEQNEKALDLKLGIVSSGWGDRAERGGERGGEQQERNRRGGGTGARGRGGGRGGARFVTGPLGGGGRGGAGQRGRAVAS